MATGIGKRALPATHDAYRSPKNRYMKDEIIVFAALLCCFTHRAQSQSDTEAWIRVSDSITGAQGYKNEAGKLVIPQGKYSQCFTDTFRNYAVVLDPGKGYVAIDRQEHAMYSIFIFDNGPDYPSGGVFRIVRDGKIGYADSATGKITVKPIFACAWPFENGMAKVALDCQTQSDGEHSTWVSDHWFYINRAGVRTNRLVKQ